MSDYKIGNEFLPFHPDASHVEPDYRDGWNACYEQARTEIERLTAERDKLRRQLDEAEPKREPLWDHEISKLAWEQNVWGDGMITFSFLSFARAVERAHGIGSDE